MRFFVHFLDLWYFARRNNLGFISAILTLHFELARWVWKKGLFRLLPIMLLITPREQVRLPSVELNTSDTHPPALSWNKSMQYETLQLLSALCVYVCAFQSPNCPTHTHPFSTLL